MKTALIEVLAEHSKGVSLAQLPIYLKKKVDFDYNLNELGFAKLKDLVNSMGDQVGLELRGHNHPFAFLKNPIKNIHEHVYSQDYTNESMKINNGGVYRNQGFS